MPATFILGIQSSGEYVQKRALSWPGGSRKAKRCDIYYGAALGHIANVGGLSLIGRISPYRPLNDDIYKPDMARSLPQLATKRRPSTLFDLANPMVL